MSTLKVTNITPQSGTDVYLTGSLIVSNVVRAREVVTTISSSQILVSGSTNFGDTIDDSHSFTGSVLATGSVVTNGPVTFQGIPWPATGSEFHLFKTDEYTVNLGSGNRNYDYLGVALEHYETASAFHNSYLVYTYDNHDNPNYGVEFNVGPVRSHLRVFPSGSSGLDYANSANLSVKDLEDGRSQALLYGNVVQIGAFNGDDILIGNVSASITQSYDSAYFYGTDLLISNTTTTVSGALAVEGVGNLSSSLATLNGSFSSSVETRLTAAESELGNTLLSSSAQIASDISGSFTSTSASIATDIATNSASLAALDSTYATDAELLTATASLSSSLATDIATNTADIATLTSATSSYALGADLSTLDGIVNSIKAVTGSYATTGSNTFTGNQIVSASQVLTLEASSPLPSGAATGSLAVSGSGANTKIYFYNGNSADGWKEISFV